MKASVHPNAFVCIVALLALPLIGFFAGCGTVTQKPVASAAASYDGNQQNSGILAEGPDGYVVTGHFRERYNALVTVYGAARTADGSPVFTPPLTRDMGLRPQADGTWLMDRQAMADMVILSDLKRRGFKP